MRRSRKTKIITMIALVVAIVGMSIGFATFSRILTISSKATVDPNRDTHKLVIYGIGDITIFESIENTNDVDFSKLSTTTSIQMGVDAQGHYVPTNKSPAIIDNSNFTISGLSADFSLELEGFSYYFFIRNEGENTIYLEDAIVNTTGVCTALDNTTQSLVDEVCDKTRLSPLLYDSALNSIVSSFPYAIEVGDFVLGVVGLVQLNTDKEIDGRYEVNFDDIQLVFSDVLPEVEEVNEE